MKYKDTELICKAIDSAVEATGYPVTGQVLATIGVDRAMIRAMERKGLVKSIDVTFERSHGRRSMHTAPAGVQVLKGYYTENVVPKALNVTE